MNPYRNLLPSLIISLIILSFLFLFVSCLAFASDKNKTPISDTSINTTPVPPKPEEAIVYIEVELESKELIYIETEDWGQLKTLLFETQNRKDNAHTIAESMRALGYNDEHPIIQFAKREWEKANELWERYHNKYIELSYDVWDAKMEEYPVATTIWLYLKELGYSDYVCAGIMGNMMAEAGGQTLNIQPDIYSPGGTFYGICQWSNLYYPEAHGLDLLAQCDYLKNNIEYEFNTFGHKYKKGFKYADFLDIENSRDAALAFAKAYERCNSGSYSIRQKNADVTYDYFVE